MTFDCYGTLIDTKPIYDAIADIAKKNELDSKDALNIYVSYEIGLCMANHIVLMIS
ncbi:FMN phosphatase YigB (HAD superfamily) [Clostridium saccharobutylicum]|uniref:hypothetical protein n=1 Tax=Clostridium saccharobutylicum TaxID=169679 RepID=UPI001F4BE8BA|nr:hypothetical protein [Clostridium saccharobutylicum]NSA20510.1 FMN phosphatase YigB (HAD superfamily) [Clostridium saccharobutylicum]